MRHGDLWIFLFFFGVLLFNWPVLTIFAGGQPYSIFALWGFFIALSAFLSYVLGKERHR